MPHTCFPHPCGEKHSPLPPLEFPSHLSMPMPCPQGLRSAKAPQEPQYYISQRKRPRAQAQGRLAGKDAASQTGACPAP